MVTPSNVGLDEESTKQTLQKKIHFVENCHTNLVFMSDLNWDKRLFYSSHRKLNPDRNEPTTFVGSVGETLLNCSSFHVWGKVEYSPRTHQEAQTVWARWGTRDCCIPQRTWLDDHFQMGWRNEGQMLPPGHKRTTSTAFSAGNSNWPTTNHLVCKGAFCFDEFAVFARSPRKKNDLCVSTSNLFLRRKRMQRDTHFF